VFDADAQPAIGAGSLGSSATDPYDLFFGRSCHLFIDKHLDVNEW
jgi:hypothetical protein